jgi:hypothetical protein
VLVASADRIAAVVAWLLASGCTGLIGDLSDRDSPRELIAAASDQEPSTAIPRLSRREFENALVSVFGGGVSGVAERYLPADTFLPYDTDQESKLPSAVFVEGLEALALEVGRIVGADPELVSTLAGCAPSGAADAECMEALARRLGRRLWRRPLTEDELAPLVSSALGFAEEEGDFAIGVRLVVQSLVQAPAFAYRLEIGVPDGPLRRLDDYEQIARLSFLIWGAGPDDALLDAAASETEIDLDVLAQRMLEDPRADAQIVRFHELWLGFRGLRPTDELAAPMLAETEALLDRVLVRDRAPWSELFTSNTTYVDATLAAHYEMDGPASGSDWVAYTHPDRAGVLSHGSFLSLSRQILDEASPTKRGRFIAERLLCFTIPDPPTDVDADQPPEPIEGGCRADAYAEHRNAASRCYSCHRLMDPIGFGLDRFDGLGRYRSHEYANPSCAVEGTASIEDTDGDLIGTFSGPRELGELLLEQGLLTRCGAQQYLRFVTGRAPYGRDAALVARLDASFVESGESFRALVLALASDPTFRFRVEE